MVSNNPFTYGNPVSDPRRFIVRRQEVEQIYSRLRNPEFESSSLVGERRMGKTSLFNYISHLDIVRRNGLDPDTYLFVHLDLQMLDPSTTPTRLYQFLLRRIGNKTKDPDLKTQLAEVSGYDTIDTYDLSDIFDIIDQKGTHIVLLMDEFQNIAGNTNFGPEFYYGLRSLAIHHNLALVTSSQNDLVELSRSDAIRSSPFFNIFANINLQPFSPGDAKTLIDLYLNGSEIAFGESEVRYLWRVSGGNPFLLQMAGVKLFDTYVQGHLESHRLPMAHASFGLEAQPHLQLYWETTSADEKIVLALLALLETQKDPQAATWTIPQLEELYRRASNVVPPLTRRGLIRKVRDGYRLFSSKFVDVVLEDITSIAPEPVDTDAWQQQAEAMLSVLPDLLRSRVASWLASTDSRFLDLFLKWLSDPHTAEAALGVITNSQAPFEERGPVLVQEEPGGTTAQTLGVLTSTTSPGTTKGALTVEDAEAEAAGGADIELLLTPPPEGHMLLSLCQWLERTAKAEIEEVAGSATGGTSVRIYLKRPVPLADMLTSLEEVESVTPEDAPSEEGGGPRFVKRRRDTRGQTPGPLRRYRVVLNPTPAPGQPLLEGEEEALLEASAEASQEQEETPLEADVKAIEEQEE